jgi:hypothetical protein
MAAFRIASPGHTILIIAPGALLPIVRHETLFDFWRKIGRQRGWNWHLNGGAIRCVDSLRYDRSSPHVLTLERDELQRPRLVVNPAIPFGLVHTGGTADLERDMRRLFACPGDAEAATADVLRLARQVEHPRA